MHNVEFKQENISKVQKLLNQRLDLIEVYDFLEINNNNELVFVGIMIDENGIEIDILINVTPDNYVFIESENDEYQVKNIFDDINIWSL